MSRPKIKRIHVNQHVIKSNLKHDLNEPVITVKSGKENHCGDEVYIDGPCTIKYSGNGKPGMSCGARVYIETTHDVWVKEDEDVFSV